MSVRGIGGISSRDTTNTSVETVIFMQADDAIPVGSAVMLDTGSTRSVPLVVPATQALDHAFIGIYEGRGGTGDSTTADFGPDRYDAVAGDAIEIVVKGPVLARVDGGTVDVAAGDPLWIFTTAGTLGPVTASAELGVPTRIIALAAQTDTLAAQVTALAEATLVYLL